MVNMKHSNLEKIIYLARGYKVVFEAIKEILTPTLPANRRRIGINTSKED